MEKPEKIGGSPETEAEQYERRRKEFVTAVTHAANYSSIDSLCDTRDYLIAEYLWKCVEAYAEAHRTENRKRAA